MELGTNMQPKAVFFTTVIKKFLHRIVFNVMVESDDFFGIIIEGNLG